MNAHNFGMDTKTFPLRHPLSLTLSRKRWALDSFSLVSMSQEREAPVKGQRSLTLGRLVNKGILVEASVLISSPIGRFGANGCCFGDMVFVMGVCLLVFR